MNVFNCLDFLIRRACLIESMENKSQRLTLAFSYACLALSMSLVGVYVALSKPLALGFGVFILAWLRFAIGAIATMHWLPKPASEPPLSFKIYLLLFAESFFGNFLFSILMLYGMALSQAFSAGIIMSCIPVAVALLSRIFLKERIQRSTQWALLLAVSGLLILNTHSASPSSTDESSASLLGHICLLGAVFCEAMYVVIGRTLSQVIQPKRIIAVINLWGLILITPLALMAIQQTGIPHVDASLWWLLLFYGLAASVGTVWLWMPRTRLSGRYFHHHATHQCICSGWVIG